MKKYNDESEKQLKEKYHKVINKIVYAIIAINAIASFVGLVFFILALVRK